jgi:hypothetical protein
VPADAPQARARVPAPPERGASYINLDIVSAFPFPSEFPRPRRFRWHRSRATTSLPLGQPRLDGQRHLICPRVLFLTTTILMGSLYFTAVANSRGWSSRARDRGSRPG